MCRFAHLACLTRLKLNHALKNSAGFYHSAFVAREASQGDVPTTLDYLGVPAADQGTIIEAWSLERDLTRKPLSDANVRKVVNAGLRDSDWGRGKLEAMGYSFEDAQLFLQL